MAIIETDLVQQPATGGARDVMMVIAVNADGTPISGGGGVAATWDTLEGKPDYIAAGNTQEDARTAIGAGTSSLTLAQSQAGIATKPAIAALTAESTLEEVIAALQA